MVMKVSQKATNHFLKMRILCLIGRLELESEQVTTDGAEWDANELLNYELSVLMLDSRLNTK
jgi:hypothetical protein